MSINGSARGGHLGSSIECRSVPARINRFDDRLGLEDGPTAFAAARQRVRLRSGATVPAVATAKIVRGRQYRSSSLASHRQILPTSRAMPGAAALGCASFGARYTVAGETCRILWTADSGVWDDFERPVGDYSSVRICGGQTSGRVFVRHVEQPLAAPDPNNTHVLRFTTVDDAKRGAYQLA